MKSIGKLIAGVVLIFFLSLTALTLRSCEDGPPSAFTVTLPPQTTTFETQSSGSLVSDVNSVEKKVISDKPLVGDDGSQPAGSDQGVVDTPSPATPIETPKKETPHAPIVAVAPPPAASQQALSGAAPPEDELHYIPPHIGRVVSHRVTTKLEGQPRMVADVPKMHTEDIRVRVLVTMYQKVALSATALCKSLKKRLEFDCIIFNSVSSEKLIAEDCPHLDHCEVFNIQSLGDKDNNIFVQDMMAMLNRKYTHTQILKAGTKVVADNYKEKTLELIKKNPTACGFGECITYMGPNMWHINHKSLYRNECYRKSIPWRPYEMHPDSEYSRILRNQKWLYECTQLHSRYNRMDDGSAYCTGSGCNKRK